MAVDGIAIRSAQRQKQEDGSRVEFVPFSFPKRTFVGGELPVFATFSNKVYSRGGELARGSIVPLTKAVRKVAPTGRAFVLGSMRSFGPRFSFGKGSVRGGQSA
jgi:hypothetical protein